MDDSHVIHFLITVWCSLSRVFSQLDVRTYAQVRLSCLDVNQLEMLVISLSAICWGVINWISNGRDSSEHLLVFGVNSWGLIVINLQQYFHRADAFETIVKRIISALKPLGQLSAWLALVCTSKCEISRTYVVFGVKPCQGLRFSLDLMAPSGRGLRWGRLNLKRGIPFLLFRTS